MKRTTVFLDDALIRKAQEAAEREGKTFAALVREAVAAYLARDSSPSDRLPSITGRFASGHPDTSERVDDLLWQDPHS